MEDPRGNGTPEHTPKAADASRMRASVEPAVRFRTNSRIALAVLAVSVCGAWLAVRSELAELTHDHSQDELVAARVMLLEALDSIE